MARPPALQWVKIPCPGSTRSAPCRPIARHMARSSSSIARASLEQSVQNRADRRSAFTDANAASMRSSAQNRLTAVGRLVRRYAVASASARSMAGPSSMPWAARR